MAFYFIYIRPHRRNRQRPQNSTSSNYAAYTTESQQLIEYVWPLMARYHQTEVRTEHLLLAILHKPGNQLT